MKTITMGLLLLSTTAMAGSSQYMVANPQSIKVEVEKVSVLGIVSRYKVNLDVAGSSSELTVASVDYYEKNAAKKKAEVEAYLAKSAKEKKLILIKPTRTGGHLGGTDGSTIAIESVPYLD